MCTKIINDQLTDLFYNFIEMEDRIAANDRYADLNSSDMRFLSAVGKGSHPRTITQVGDTCVSGDRRHTMHPAASSGEDIRTCGGKASAHLPWQGLTGSEDQGIPKRI